MTDKQPEALRLADLLDGWSEGPQTVYLTIDAAAELRRLYDENQQLREANEAHDQRQKWWNEQLFQRQQEVERLRDRLEIDDRHSVDGIEARDETIRLLEQEHDEDQRVIAVWRGRCERLEQDVEYLRDALRKIARVNAMDYEYRAWARIALGETND